MKKLFLITISLLIVTNSAFAKTLVKYHKNTGEILQTNTVSEMPSDEILNDRFKSETTDVLLVDNPVDISTQKVDLNKKKIVNISQGELNSRAKIAKDKQDKLEADKQKAIEKIRAIVKDLTDEEVRALF